MSIRCCSRLVLWKRSLGSWELIRQLHKLGPPLCCRRYCLASKTRSRPLKLKRPGSAFPGLGGLGGLLGSIGGLGGGRLLDNVTSNEPTEVDKGNQILGQLFGSKDGSRAVAASAAAQSGVQPSLLKKMLPILAMVAAGYVMKQASQGQGGLGGALGGILGGQSSGSSPDEGRNLPLGSSGILDDLIGAAGKYLGR